MTTLYFPGLWTLEQTQYGYSILHNGREVGGAQDIDKAIDMIMMKLSPGEHAEYWRKQWIDKLAQNA